MNLIKPYYEILDVDNISLVKSIELSARNCYKSEDKISEDESSALELCNKLTARKHDAMIEFGYDIIVEVPQNIKYSINNNISKDSHIELSTSIRNTTRTKELTDSVMDVLKYYKDYRYIKTNGENRCILSGSARAIINAFASKGATPVLMAIVKLYPDLLLFISKDRQAYFKEYEDIILPFKKLTYDNLTDGERLIHTTKTVRFVSNRGFSHELVRHRPASFAQESTRYVNYGKGNGELNLIIPHWAKNITSNINTYSGMLEATFDILEPVELNWLYQAELGEKYYLEVVKPKGKLSPQDVRDMLPIAVKAEIIMKTRLSHWIHIFKQRTAKGAHPQMRELMIPLLEEFKEMNPYFKELE